MLRACNLRYGSTTYCTVQVPVNSYGKVPKYHSTTVGKFYRISADIRGSDCAQQAIKASLVVEVVVAAEVVEDMWKVAASFCAIWRACSALVRPP
eukprot:SAG11_NODE_1347_length_5137_cov_15.361651_2_plen_95_part_00